MITTFILSQACMNDTDFQCERIGFSVVWLNESFLIPKTAFRKEQGTVLLQAWSIVFIFCCRREAIAPLQTKEAVEIRLKSDMFAEKVEDFRKFFLAKAPFRIKGNDLGIEHVSPGLGCPYFF